MVAAEGFAPTCPQGAPVSKTGASTVAPRGDEIGLDEKWSAQRGTANLGLARLGAKPRVPLRHESIAPPRARVHELLTLVVSWFRHIRMVGPAFC